MSIEKYLLVEHLHSSFEVGTSHHVLGVFKIASRLEAIKLAKEKIYSLIINGRDECIIIHEAPFGIFCDAKDMIRYTQYVDPDGRLIKTVDGPWANEISF